MAVLPLVQLQPGHFYEKQTLLRSPSVAVEDFGSPTVAIIRDLMDTFLAHKIAIGLAAPQIGVQQRIAVVNVNPERSGTTLILVNPIIISSSGKKDKKHEGCMSLPDFQGEVERRRRVTVSYQDHLGKARSLEAEGFLARVVYHELDHLEGVLYVDRMSPSAPLEPAAYFKAD